MTAPDVRTDAQREVRLDHLLGTFVVGSGDWSWQDEYDELYSRDYQWALTAQIRCAGITEPILLGSDGRVWDGHHRICAAMHLGLDVVPVEFCTPVLVTPTREQIADALWGFPVSVITLSRLNELAKLGLSNYSESRDYVYAQADAVLALMNTLTERNTND